MKRVIDICDNWKFCEEDLEPRKPTDGWGGAKARAYFKGAASADFDDTAKRRKIRTCATFPKWRA